MLTSNAIEEYSFTGNQFLSTYFTISNSDGAQRFIENLKKLKEFISLKILN